MKSHVRYVLVGLAVAVLAGCGSAGGDNKAEAASFAAPVEGSEAFVGAVVGESDGRILAYVCDGKSIASWFTGNAADDGTIALTSTDGARLTGRVDDDALTGSFTLPGGASYRFHASTVTTPAGLYRAKGEVRGVPAVGGWVVLEDGSQRGASRSSSGFTSTDTDLARPPKPVTSFTSSDVDF